MNDKSSSIHRLQVRQASYMGKYCNEIIRQKAEIPFLMQKKACRIATSESFKAKKILQNVPMLLHYRRKITADGRIDKKKSSTPSRTLLLLFNFLLRIDGGCRRQYPFSAIRETKTYFRFIVPLHPFCPWHNGSLSNLHSCSDPRNAFVRGLDRTLCLSKNRL